MASAFYKHLSEELSAIKNAGLYKDERVISSPQKGKIKLSSGAEVLNFCANNYLGLADDPDLIEAAHAALEKYGFGMASVRAICGTQTVHKELEVKIASFLRMDDTILYSSCFDANTGLFETLLGPEDAIFSDALNHASIIDGIRLCKARRFRYANNDMSELAKHLESAKDARFKLIATDGVFSMDGIIANLPDICDLAERHKALVMVDDSHAVGFMGEGGRGTAAYCQVEDRVDIITGTLGKALGGASGGYVAGRSELIDYLRQRSRPYLFSNTLAPVITSTSIRALELVEKKPELRQQLERNSKYFRTQMQALGFTLAGADHAIIPVMIGDATLAKKMANMMLEQNIYVIGFSYPIVPKGQARIRTQMSATHSIEDIDLAVSVFAEVGRELKIII